MKCTVKVTIACGLPKGDKLDLIVQKGTELGMSSIIPFEAERSIVKWDSKKGDKKVERLRKDCQGSGGAMSPDDHPGYIGSDVFQAITSRVPKL